ncbi:translation initiation factor IF-2 [Candidatus Haliotispira prima]|uniref:Translation initiation factor IF-2 n=1 Tax=Candidatus Haliotispira prima TaxID=3034016 RepID=A0ABY8MHT8_9SPIO|nr:translation initiation factor IF-2 [Candidatus Haliotispira prima]
MAEENKKVIKKTGPTLVKKKHTPTSKNPHGSGGDTAGKKVVRKVVRKVAVKKPGARPEAKGSNNSAPARNDSAAGKQAGSAVRGGGTRPVGDRKLSPEQLERLREARRKAQPTVQFEITRPPRKRTAGERSRGPGGPKSAGGQSGSAGPGQRGNRGPRPGAPGTNNNLSSTIATAGMSGSPPPAGAQKAVARGSDSRRSSKEREKMDRRREDLEHFASQVRRKKAFTAADVVPKEISIMESITVSELARKMNLKASDIIGKLMKQGAMASINQSIDSDTASVVAKEFDCKVNVVSLYEETLIESEHVEQEDYVKRAPVVTIMGHVDHGKTTLLDALRESDVAQGEHGGITQHIGAYQVHMPGSGGTITFLDTPGHAAFTMMRARGAQVTDLIVLIVAADDGVMPQTIEAINHAKEAKVPIVVTITKSDLETANPERVKQQLSEHDLMPSDWGGQTSYVEVSAVSGKGLPELLETIVLETEILELKAPVKGRAEGKVIEARVDQGRGIVATVLIERGTLRVGDTYVAGVYSGKVRAMFNEYGSRLEEATPSTPVEIIGLSGAPLSGDPFQATENEKLARQYGQKRQELKKQEANQVAKLTLDNLYDQIRDKSVRELKVIIKGDVYGSVEAVQQALEKLSNDEIRLACIHSAAGAIIESDVTLASASNAIIIGFHVRPTVKAQALADQEKVDIRKYGIIYDVVDDIRTAMEGMLSPDKQEHVIGEVEVRTTFRNSQVGTIAGCMVVKGLVTRKSLIRIFRNDVEIHFGRLSGLKRFKEDAREVRDGFECGITIANFTDIQEGDRFEAIEEREVAKKLKVSE